MDLITVDREKERQFRVKVRGHDVLTDMPAGDGGQGAGFSPVEMLAGSLGACIAMIVQGYCNTHGYFDGDVAVSVALEMGENPKRVSAVAVDVELPEGFPEEKIDVVRRVAELCPVHETLKNPPQVDVEFT